MDDVIEYALYFLELSHLDIDIDVQFEKITEAGFCIQIDNDTFLIQIKDNMGRDETLKTLFHEMVHVKQQISGEYVVEESQLGRRKWKGRYYDCEYALRPWEREAHELESLMFDSWLMHNKNGEYNGRTRTRH